MKEQIIKYIKNLEDHPRMHDLVVRFFRVYNSGTPAIVDATEFMVALLELLDEGQIYYDSKHDAWLYTGIDNPKLQKLVDESVRIT